MDSLNVDGALYETVNAEEIVAGQGHVQLEKDTLPGNRLGSPASAPIPVVETPNEGNISDGIAHNPTLQAVTTGSTSNAHAQIDGLDVDSNTTNTDSAIDDIQPPSSTASLNSSIYDSVLKHGRSYHKYKDGKYMLPNDEIERNRLDMQHHLWLLTLQGKLHLAPIKPGLHHALDIGTGTGIWATEFATEYPSANVIGTDLSPIQPLYVPPNCCFEIDDAEDEWVYGQEFDYIHGRLLALCFNDGAAVFKKAFKALAPGGYFEMQDALTLTCIDSSGENTALMRWVNLMLEAATKLGRDWAKVKRYKGWMEDAGFVDVKETYWAWPTNTWAKGDYHKTLGAWCNADLRGGLEGFSMLALSKAMGMKKEEIQALLDDVRNDLNNRNIHAYMPILVVYGRKPE